MTEPASISTAKCCDKYTREYPTNAATMKKVSFNHLFLTSNDNPKKMAKADVVCPEGKL